MNQKNLFRIHLFLIFAAFSGSTALLAAPPPAGVAITIQNASGTVLAAGTDPKEVVLTCQHAYQKGDTVVVAGSNGAKFFFVQIDPAVPESLVYTPVGKITYPIPFDRERRDGYDPAAFGGENHSIKARLATPSELSTYRNVAANALDKRGQIEYFPHATANFVTRDDPQFYERNAIDGNKQNSRHGSWPYESWGPGQRNDAQFKLDFGREVEIDKVRIFIRCDFPHDTCWKSLTMRFSDGSTVEASIEKKAEGQDFTFPKKKVSWVQLENLQQISTPLGWAALTEIEVYGSDPARKP